MGLIHERMLDDLKLRRCRPATMRKYVASVRAMEAYHGRPAEQMGAIEARMFLLHLATKVLLKATTQRF